MGIYNTYVDAVIANGSTKGVYSDGGRFFTDGVERRYYNVHQCNPADHLGSLEDFRDNDKKLITGDVVTLGTGSVIILNESLTEVWNTQSDGDNERFILQAAADSEDTDTTWKPVVGDEVSTCEGIGKVLTTVVRDNLTGYIVQFENDWNEFDLTQLSPVDYDYENGKAVHELWYSCLFDESWYSCLFDELNNPDFNDLTVEARGRWIEFAKLVKRA